MIEEPTLFDTQLIGLYIIGLALVGFLGECTGCLDLARCGRRPQRQLNPGSRLTHCRLPSPWH